MRLLEFMFRSLEHFVGTVILILLLEAIIINIVRAFTGG